MPPGSTSALDAACFPMVPWCNRIANARFVCEAQTIALTPNFTPEPHAIHGHGWLAEWAVASAARDHCTLTYRHSAPGAGWPWAYEAEQRIALSRKGCLVVLTLTNRADTPMPAGLGLHPYLRRSPESRINFRAKSIYAVGDDMIPNGGRLLPGSFGDFAQTKGAALPADAIDHCFIGWDGRATITDDAGIITLTARGAAHLHLYAPGQSGILCLEPVSHLPDALNRDPASVAMLAPGASASLEMEISAATQ